MRRRSGGCIERSGKLYARVTIGKTRPLFLIAATVSRSEADERAELVARACAKLVKIGRTDLAKKLGPEIAAAATNKQAMKIMVAVDQVAAGVVSTERPTEGVTFAEHAGDIASGALSEKYPDHLPPRAPKTMKQEAFRLREYINPVIGQIPVVAITVSLCDEVMSALPKKLKSSTRRAIAQIMFRAMRVAAYPCKLITASPLPSGWLPRVKDRPTFSFLYPDEEATLLACRDVSIVERVFYGFLAREGLRAREALTATWGNFDLVRGTFRLDESKTGRRGTWALDPGSLAAMRLWEKHPARPDSTKVFVKANGRTFSESHIAKAFRTHLEEAGLTREELFLKSKGRSPIRVHDLRATFITMAFARGRSEAWIQDRTGHTTSAMLNRYRRDARLLVELDLGDLRPLDTSVPELTEAPVHVAGIQPGSKRVEASSVVANYGDSSVFGTVDDLVENHEAVANEDYSQRKTQSGSRVDPEVAGSAMRAESPTPVRLLAVRIESADGKTVYANAERSVGDTRKTLARKLSLSLRKGSPVTLEAIGGRVRVSAARGSR